MTAKFILVTWEDVYRQPFHVELFPGELEAPDLLKYLEEQKSDYFDRKVIARSETGLHFDDGTSVFLQLLPVQRLEPKYWFIEPLQLESEYASTEIEVGERSPESL